MSTSVSHDHIGLSVTPQDREPTIDWYAKAFGFVVDMQFDAHGISFTFLTSGDVKIELVSAASTRQDATDDVMNSMDPSRLHHFCLAVDDLDEAIADLTAQGVAVIGAPMEVPEVGQRIAFVTDNLGNIIELAEPGTRKVR